jgi:histidine triad (HIT) family protein
MTWSAIKRVSRQENEPMTYDDNNIFAKILRGELPCEKVYETEHALAFMDIMPRGDGHVLVLPKARARNILDVAPDVLAELMKAVQIVARAAKQALNADGLTIQQFNEAAGGQVVFHLHVHILPRFEGVPLKPHTGQMEKPEVLADFAERIRAALPG